MKNSVANVTQGNCTGCAGCINKCPHNAISLSLTLEGFRIPVVNENRCTNCGLCLKVCHWINPPKGNTPLKVFSGINKDISILENSSSGGAFSVLAEYIIENGGVVFGAQYDDSFAVFHSYSTTLEGIAKYRQSKYIESDLKNTFQEAKEFLDQNRYVLFSGTPCQIAGLKNFIGKSHEKLITIDLVCHGTPSPLLLKKYIEFIEKENKSKCIRINMRSKKLPWLQFPIYIEFLNGKIIKESGMNNLFLRLFCHTKLSVRKTCNCCHYSSPERIGDFTLADFWGVSHIHPEISNEKGVSLILLNSKIGLEIWNKISKNINFTQSTFENASIENDRLISSSINDEGITNHKFYLDLKEMNFKKFCKKYLPKPQNSKIPFLMKCYYKMCYEFSKFKKLF